VRSKAKLALAHWALATVLAVMVGLVALMVAFGK
jgi:hypothetical protein